MIQSAIRLGVVVGAIFGIGNLVYSWLFPLADDTPAALLAFYGPMFSVWAAASFVATRRTGRLLTGVLTGTAIAFATFCVYDLLVLARVNLFLTELTGRSDWQYLMKRFDASGFESLRLFVSLENIKGAPLKIGVASLIGAIMGLFGGSLGRWTRATRGACR